MQPKFDKIGLILSGPDANLILDLEEYQVKAIVNILGLKLVPANDDYDCDEYIWDMYPEYVVKKIMRKLKFRELPNDENGNNNSSSEE